LSINYGLSRCFTHKSATDKTWVFMLTKDFEIVHINGVTATCFLHPPDRKVFGAAAAEVRAHFPRKIKLWDCSCGISLTPAELRIMAEDSKTVDAETLRVAFVAPSDAVYGLARLFAIHRAQAHLQLQVFRDRDNAFEWLESMAKIDG
jgi:hypothetical protein